MKPLQHAGGVRNARRHVFLRAPVSITQDPSTSTGVPRAEPGEVARRGWSRLLKTRAPNGACLIRVSHCEGHRPGHLRRTSGSGARTWCARSALMTSLTTPATPPAGLGISPALSVRLIACWISESGRLLCNTGVRRALSG